MAEDSSVPPVSAGRVYGTSASLFNYYLGRWIFLSMEMPA